MTAPARMRIGIPLPYASGFADSVAQLPDYERAGASIVYVAEVYSFDAVSQLGFLAARTESMQIASNILPIYTRTPALIAMTAAGLDHVSGGRFTLGIGASGPQVVEGFHGVAYDAPVGRTRDVIEICRSVWRRERLQFSSARYDIPLTPQRGGSGLGKALKLIQAPVRDDIPIMVAAMGPRNVQLAAELAQEWVPFFYRPEGADEVWGTALAAGYATRDPALGPRGIVVPTTLAIGEDVDHLLDEARPSLALYIGGMGARGQNFYYDLACRYGYERDARRVQDLYLAGHKQEAAASVPIDLLRSIALVGPLGYVRERVAAYREAGVTTFAVTSLGATHEQRLRNVEALAGLIV